jgi:hypothetical protein
MEIQVDKTRDYADETLWRASTTHEGKDLVLTFLTDGRHGPGAEEHVRDMARFQFQLFAFRGGTLPTEPMPLSPQPPNVTVKPERD